MNRRKFDTIVRRAERDARIIVEAELRAKLPSGWAVYLMVGWGLIVKDATGKNLVSDRGTDKERLSKKQTKALELVADYVDLFGYDNSRIDI